MKNRPSARVVGVVLVALAYSIFCLYIWPPKFGSVGISRLALIIVGSFVVGIHWLDGPVFLVLSPFLFLRRRSARGLAIVYAIVMCLLSFPAAVWYLLNPVGLEAGNFFVLQAQPKGFGMQEPYLTALVMAFAPTLAYLLIIGLLIGPKAKAEFRLEK